MRVFCEALQELHQGLPLILAGFSQGGMLACDSILLGSLRASGLVLMSSSRIAIKEWRPHLPAVKGLPVLVAHGLHDRELSIHAGENLRDMLLEGGAEVTWLSFDGGHDIPLPVWRQFRRFAMGILRTHLSFPDPGTSVPDHGPRGSSGRTPTA